MSGTVVVDASFVMALLTVREEGAAAWAIDLVEEHELVAPHLMPVEVTSALRSAERRRLLTSDAASVAHRDLVDLGVELHPFEPFAQRVWELRHSMSPYDAWYIAVAESLEIPLVTLDLRLTRAVDVRCHFIVPP